MDFARVEAEFGRLKAQFESGALTEAAFKAQLEELMIKDEQGRWWILGYETGQWYVHDGEKWVQQEPPRAAPAPPAARPSYPQATEVIPDAQPAPAASAPSRPLLGLKLGRDDVSALMIAVGWFVLWAGLAEVIGDVPLIWGPMALIGGLGGLITSLVLRRTEPPSPWRQVPVVTLGWGIGMVILVMLHNSATRSWMVSGAVGGFIAGLITALVLKWTHPSIQRKHVAVVALGWALGWAVGGAIGWSICGRGCDPYYVDAAQGALWGGISGAVGGWIMFWQLREARQNAP